MLEPLSGDSPPAPRDSQEAGGVQASDGHQSETSVLVLPRRSALVTLKHTLILGYHWQFTGIRDQVLPRPLNVQLVSKHLLWIPGLLPNLTLHQGCTAGGRVGGVGGGGGHFKEYCKMLIHSTTLQLPNVTSSHPRCL